VAAEGGGAFEELCPISLQPLSRCARVVELRRIRFSAPEAAAWIRAELAQRPASRPRHPVLIRSAPLTDAEIGHVDPELLALVAAAAAALRGESVRRRAAGEGGQDASEVWAGESGGFRGASEASPEGGPEASEASPEGGPEAMPAGHLTELRAAWVLCLLSVSGLVFWASGF
jgi:hypothetical protein